MKARPTGRHLLWLLAPATFFDGYDALLLGLALPLIRAEFGLSLAQAGVMGSVVFAGSLGGLVLIALADRFGRRLVMTLTIVGYALATGLTAVAVGALIFTTMQVIARVFLGAEKPLATIMAVETMPRERGGHALAVLSSMLALGQASAGLGFLLVSAFGTSWRILYAVGVVPLLLISFARRHLPDTVRPDSAELMTPLRLSDLRSGPVLGASGLAFMFAIFPTALTVFASTMVIEEWRWDLTSLNPLYFVLWALGLSGFFVAGRIMDTRGRRPAGILFLFGSSLAGFAAFTASTDPGRALGLAAVIFFLTGSTTVVSAFTTEPFTAGIRGRIGGVVHLFDIAGAAAAPALVGLMAGVVGGVGFALALVGLSYAVGRVLIVTLLPETRISTPEEAP